MINRVWGPIFVLILTLSFSSTAFAKKHDLEYWHTESIAYKIAKDWKVTLGEEGYLNDTASHPYYESGDLGLVYSGVGKWLDLGLNFMHIVTGNTNKWLREERPHINATLRYVVKGFDVSDRNRVEYRIRQRNEDIWRYRNLLTVRFPFKCTSKDIRPYVANEIIVDCDKKQLSEERIYAGFTFKINSNIGADIYYMFRRVKAATITYNDIVGTRFTYAF